MYVLCTTRDLLKCIHYTPPRWPVQPFAFSVPHVSHSATRVAPHDLPRSSFFSKISSGSVGILRSRDNHLLCERTPWDTTRRLTSGFHKMCRTEAGDPLVVILGGGVWGVGNFDDFDDMQKTYGAYHSKARKRIFKNWWLIFFLEY